MEPSFAGLWSPSCNDTVQSRIPVIQRYRRRRLPQGPERGSQLGLDPDSILLRDPNNGFSAATGLNAGLLQILEALEHRLAKLPLCVGGSEDYLGDEDQRVWLTRLSRSLHLFEAGQRLLFFWDLPARERFAYPRRGH